MKTKKDYMIFWADEGTCFGYAMQWFGIAFTIFCLTLTEFRRLFRWRF